jgi:hypothetical protein
MLANPEAYGGVARAAAAHRAWDAPAPLRLWHLASLDAPSVAVAWALGFAWVVRARLPVWLLVAMALTVWVVYAGDRLLDARASLRSGRIDRLRARHQFHWSHRRILTPLAVAAAMGAAGIVFSLMPPAAFERNTVLAGAALVYFARVHSGGAAPALVSFRVPFLTKEMLVGVLFTAGCALPAWNHAPTDAWALAGPVVFFAALAWLNCHAIECWEAGGARATRDQASSALGVEVSHPCAGKKAQGWGTAHLWARRDGAMREVVILGGGLCLAGLLLAVCLCIVQPRLAVLLLAGSASALLLALLDRLRGRMTPLALRVAADLVLLTPLALPWR